MPQGKEDKMADRIKVKLASKPLLKIRTATIKNVGAKKKDTMIKGRSKEFSSIRNRIKK